MYAEKDIDGFIAVDAELIACLKFGNAFALAANTGRGMLKLCISDAAKQMLLNNRDFIPHLLSGLLLDPECARKDTAEEIKAVVQRDFAECIQQISLFPPGAKALQAAADAIETLDALVEHAWTAEAKDSARGALMQLTDRHREATTAIDPDARHVMLSCECDPSICCRHTCAY
jgi:hypothetical protein